MICVSVAENSFPALMDILEREYFVEVRLDLLAFSRNQVKKIFSSPAKLIATCRPGKFSDDEREGLLLEAIRAGANYVDIELFAQADFREHLIKDARIHGCSVIVSYHNEKNMPSRKELSEIMRQCFNMGADFAKIVCRAVSREEADRILSLYETYDRMIAFATGECGVFTRIASLFLGAPFIYASLAPGKETGVGQLDKDTIRFLIKGSKYV